MRGGKVIKEGVGHNMVVTQGINKMLDIMFYGETQITGWSIGLINNTPAPSLSSSDTLASHVGWSEFTDVDARATWAPAGAVLGVQTNGSPIEITITDTGVVYGFFMTDAASGSSGVLWATAGFSTGVLSVIADDVIKITYSITVA